MDPSDHEQVSGRSSEVGAPLDVYALGILTHERLTGETPFDLRGKLLHESARIEHRRQGRSGR